MSYIAKRFSRFRAGRAFWVLAIGLVAATAIGAETGEVAEIDWFTLLMSLFGGLALFLFGIDQMSEGLKAVAGQRMAGLLGGMTRNRFLGALTGAIVTAVLNSSSVTTVLVVSFITAGIMSLQQSIGVIMGANIGSTMTAQIVAFNVTQYALIPVTIGFAMIFFGKTDRMKHSGEMLFGLGLLFGGMGIMSEGMYPLRSYQPFLDLMARMENPVLGILVGAAFTALVQSSVATTGIAIVMAAEGLLSLPAGIALALGANIGTCMTAVLAAIGKPVAARRAAAAHVLFNVLGVLIWIPFIGLLAGIVVDISPAAPQLEGAARMAAEVPRQIANAHTTFNVINTVLFIGFAGWFAKAVERIVPEQPETMKEIIRPKYIEEALLDTPTLALNAARMEVQHLGEIAMQMVHQVGPAIRNRSNEELEVLERLGDQVDLLHAHIIDYLGEVRRHELTDGQRDAFLRLMRGADEVERIGEVVEAEIIPVGRALIASDLKASETTRHTLDALYRRVCDSVEEAITAIAELDAGRANNVINMKGEINGLIDDALNYQAERVSPTDPDLIRAFRLEDEVIDALKRIYSLSKRISKLLLPVAVAAKAA